MPRGFYEYNPSGKQPLRLACRYLRHTVQRLPLTHDPPSPTCYMPGTFVLAAQDYPMGRDVFYVNLRGLFQDGIWLPYAKRVDDRSIVVDSVTLGPRGSITRKPSRADRREFRRWCKIIANQWREWAENNTPCDQYRTRWQSLVDRFTGGADAASVMLNSEVEIERFDNWCRYQYAREAVFHPTVPNRIFPNSAGGSREILAFARIVPRLQADAGLHKFSQRVWYVDHRGDEPYVDGASPRATYTGYVDLRTIRAGLVSRPYDGRDLKPIDNLNELLTLKKRWLENLEKQS